MMRGVVAFRAVQKQHEEHSNIRFPTRGKQLKRFQGLSLENGSSQGHNLALTVFIVPNSIDSGRGRWGLVAHEKEGPRRRVSKTAKFGCIAELNSEDGTT